MMSFTSPSSTANPYVHLLVAALTGAGQQIEFLNWWRLLTGRVRTVHVHWPETMLQRNSRLGRTANRVLFAGLLVRSFLGLTRVVRTLHNLRPHEKARSKVDQLLLEMLDRATHVWICLNPLSECPSQAPALLIPHGELASWYEGVDREPTSQQFDVLSFGLIRPYKGTESLLAASRNLPTLTFMVAGRPTSPELKSRLIATRDVQPNVHLDLRHVPDSSLRSYIEGARLVVLPYARFENSGAALLALDLGTPILVPEGPTASLLQSDFGEDWVQLFAPPLTADAIRHALTATAARAFRPIAPERTWAEQATAHIRAYRLAWEAHVVPGGAS